MNINLVKCQFDLRLVFWCHNNEHEHTFNPFDPQMLHTHSALYGNHNVRVYGTFLSFDCLHGNTDCYIYVGHGCFSCYFALFLFLFFEF